MEQFDNLHISDGYRHRGTYPGKGLGYSYCHIYSSTTMHPLVAWDTSIDGQTESGVMFDMHPEVGRLRGSDWHSGAALQQLSWGNTAAQRVEVDTGQVADFGRIEAGGLYKSAGQWIGTERVLQADQLQVVGGRCYSAYICSENRQGTFPGCLQ